MDILNQKTVEVELVPWAKTNAQSNYLELASFFPLRIQNYFKLQKNEMEISIC